MMKNIANVKSQLAKTIETMAIHWVYSLNATMVLGGAKLIFMIPQILQKINRCIGLKKRKLRLTAIRLNLLVILITLDVTWMNMRAKT